MKKSDAYHHGNLRLALLDAARELMEDSGIESLTLREVARRAGVSPSAPYHHFKDKADLIRELVSHGFQCLDRASHEAIRGKMIPQEKLQAIGVTYVMYAVQHPAEFRLMFRPEMGSPLEDENPTCTPVFRVLLQVIDEFQFVWRDRNTAAISVWSLVHGLASLLVDGPLHSMTADLETVHALAVQVTSAIDLADSKFKGETIKSS
ncbi:Transcriptional regulator [Gloeomargarita lithophora Alchichica-D10]|uniref:Transcriptional regulator n=2 Tax=Gloeomargarita TaxID=1188227 RepID=A0A1J0A920_9CYAN|nr:Transcriptional regulator [Gloeomargarita lithophora Alchichica-D10]